MKLYEYYVVIRILIFLNDKIGGPGEREETFFLKIIKIILAKNAFWRLLNIRKAKYS